MRLAVTLVGLLIAFCVVSVLGAAPKSLRLTDSSRAPQAVRFSDAAEFAITPEADALVFTLTMREPLAPGMFTCCHVYMDCDGDQETGIGGNELWVRGAVGSRFRPNDWEPPEGLPRPLELTRASWSKATSAEMAGSSAMIWQHSGTLPSPTVEGKTLTFRVPNELILRRGGKGTTSTGSGARISLYASVETTCSEHPIVFDYDARDEGLPITVDGAVLEWSGGPVAEDEGGELHATTRFLDVNAVWCDHGKDRLYLRLDVEEEGFEEAARRGKDVIVSDSVTVVTQPVGDRYAEPTRSTIPAALVRLKPLASGLFHKAVGQHVEIEVARNPSQARLRVTVWTEARRRDRIPDNGSVDVTLGGGK